MWKRMFYHCYCSNNKDDHEVSEKTGFDRVKLLYSQDDYGLSNPQVFFMLQNSLFSVAVSALAGALIHSSKAKDEYLRKNVASTYESQFLAKRHLTDNITLSGAKGAFKYAMKYGSFSSLYLICTVTAANYNNKITVYEHIGTGALLGALYRFNFGPKGMAVAGCLGGVLGAFAGGAIVSFLWYKNIGLQELIDIQSESYYQLRKKYPAHAS